MLTIVGQSREGTLHGGCGQDGAGTVVLITFGAHLAMGASEFHLDSLEHRLSWYEKRYFHRHLP